MAYFNAIVGDIGSGKTCFMTRYAYLNSKEGMPIISNYALKGIKHRVMSFTEFVSVVSDRKRLRSIEGSTVYFDELGVGADSYDFFSKDVKAITSFVAQIRKLHVTAYYTVQRMSMIARRLRISTGAFIFMEDLDPYNMIGPDGKRAKQHRDICAGLFRASMVNEYQEPIGIPRTFDGKRYWPMYDTDEIIWA